MPNIIATDPERLANLRSCLAADPSGVLEAAAVEAGESLRTIVACLPASLHTFASGECAEEIMSDIAEWGEITFLVHTADIILECKGHLPHGSFARGFYNLASNSGPIGGHLRLDRCASVAFVRRPFMGASDSCAVIFFNNDGEAMFKVFVGRDEQHHLRADQVARFTSLRGRLGRAAEE